MVFGERVRVLTELNSQSARARLCEKFLGLVQSQGLSGVKRTRHTDIIPLDDQWGERNLRTVPDGLQSVFFDADPDKPTHLYTILDAAKIAHLPELLETTGLPHACLFKGEAEAELGSVAPWIVALEDGHAFTRGLFTRGDSDIHMWDLSAGIFVRSTCDLTQIRDHFRKFTKVRDANEKWYFFRFWEPAYAAGLLTNGDPATAQRFLAVGAVIAVHSEKDAVDIFEPDAPVADNQVFSLKDQDMWALSDVAVWAFAERLALWLSEACGPFADDFQLVNFAYGGIVHARTKAGLVDEKAVAEYVAACWLLGFPAELQYALQTGAMSPARAAQAYQDGLKLQNPT